MATPFRLKRSAVADRRPTTTDLQLGELALNTHDGFLYAETTGVGSTVSLLTPWREQYGSPTSIYYNHRVGIGSTNPTVSLDVVGDTIFQSNLDVAGIATLGSGSSGQAFLQYQGSTKLATANWGVSVTGTLQATNFIKTLNQSSSTNGKSIFLTNTSGNLLEIGHTSSNSFITGHVGNISINAPQVSISTNFSVGGISTFTDTVNINGVIEANSNLNVDGNLDVDGHTELDNLRVSGISTFSGDIRIQTSDLSKSLQIGEITGSPVNYLGIQQVAGSSIKGFATQYDNASVFENLQGSFHQHLVLGDSTSGNNGTIFGISLTESGTTYERLKLTGVGDLFVTRNLDVDGTANLDDVDIDGNLDVDGHTELDNLRVSGISTFQDNIFTGVGATVGFGTTAYFRDNARAVFGDGEDLSIYHDSEQSYLSDQGEGGFRILTSTFRVRNPGDNSTFISAANNYVSLNYDGDQRLKTTEEGVLVSGGTTTGNLNVTGISTFAGQVGFGTHITLEDYGQIQLGEKSGGDFFIGHNPTLYGGVYNTLVSTSGNILLENRDTGGQTRFLYLKSNAVQLRSYTGNESFLTANLNQDVKIYYDNSERFATTTYGALLTGGTSGIGTLAGPATFHIDPVTVGDNTGTVVIKGNLQVDGTTTTINSTTVSVDDKNLELGSGAANDAAADGGGITIISGDGNKTFNFESTGSNLGSSENINIATGKVYKVNNVETLSATTLGSAVVNSSLTNLGTLTSLKVSGIVTFSSDLSVAENIVHTGDTDTKINFPPAGNIIRFNTNGEERLRIGSSGRVGLGTNNPEARLDIYDDNTSSTGLLQLSQKGTGDASINFRLVGAGPNNLGLYDTIAEWTAGVDNSDNDKFKINTKSILGHSSGVDAVAITTAGNVSVAKDFDVDGHTELDNLNVAGVSTFNDNVKLLDADVLSLGTGQDLQISHENDVSLIRDTRAGVGATLAIGADKLILRNKDGNESYLEANDNGSVKIYYDFAPKLETSGVGVTITSQLDTTNIYATGITTSVGTFHIRPSSGALSPKISYVDSIADAMIWADNVEARFGGSSDFRIYHETPGDLNIIETHNDRQIHIRELDGTDIAKFIPGGSVELYENGTKRLETTDTGVGISSNLTVSGVSTFTGAIDANGSMDIASDLTVNGLLYTGLNSQIIVDASGGIDCNGFLDVDGHTELDNVNVSGISTFGGVINSTVSTGTAPFTVSSTTKVTNLNADLLDGKSTANSNVGNSVVVRNAAGGFSAGDVTFANITAGITTNTGVINSQTDIRINNVSVIETALNDAVAMAIALG